MAKARVQNSFLINLSSSIVNQSATDFTTFFPNVISLGSTSQWELRLCSLSVWNTQLNVSDAFGNRSFRFSDDAGASWETGTIPAGVYGAGDLIDAINTIMDQSAIGVPGDTPDFTKLSECIALSINEPTLGFSIQFYGAYPGKEFAIDLTNNGTSNLYNNFGTANRAYGIVGDPPVIDDPTNQQILFPFQANVSNDITSYNVLCDIASSTTTAGASGQTIATFVPNNVPPGALYNTTPPFPIPVEVGQTAIQSIRIQIQDNLGRPVKLQEGVSSLNVNATTLSLLLTRLG